MARRVAKPKRRPVEAVPTPMDEWPDHQRRAYERIDPRWQRRHRDPDTGGWCEPGSYSHELRGFVPPCDHEPPRWARSRAWKDDHPEADPRDRWYVPVVPDS